LTFGLVNFTGVSSSKGSRPSQKFAPQTSIFENYVDSLAPVAESNKPKGTIFATRRGVEALLGGTAGEKRKEEGSLASGGRQENARARPVVV
jgi:hypothetical protein